VSHPYDDMSVNDPLKGGTIASRHDSPNYRWLAGMYDRLIGDAAFPEIRRSFDWAVIRYGVHFRSAADIGCGTGRFIRYLRRNYRVPVEGVDRSVQMLRAAHMRNQDPEVHLMKQDLRTFKLPHPVDLITCNFDTLNYFIRYRDLAKVFVRCRENLVDSGHLIFDLLTGDTGSPGRQMPLQRIGIPGVTTLWLAAWSPRNRLSVVTIYFIFKDCGHQYRVAREVHRQRWYPLPFVAKMLRSAGFALRGARDLSELGATSPVNSWMKLVAQKA
jgi:SAM-dependent methyltransferase